MDDLATRRESWIGFAGGVVALVPLGLFGWAWWKAFEILLAWPWDAVAQAAEREGAWLHGGLSWPYWVGLMLTPFVVLLLGGLLWTLAILRAPAHPRPSAAASVLRDATQGEGSAITQWLYRRSVRAARDAPTPQAFLKAFARDQVKVWSCATAATAVVAIGMISLGAQDYWLATPSGVVRHGIGGNRTYAWRDATLVKSSCERDKNTGLLVYDVSFRGWTVALGTDGSTAEGVSRAAQIEGLERVDDALRSAGVPHERRRWRDKNPMHPECVGFWAHEAGEDGDKRLNRILAAP